MCEPELAGRNRHGHGEAIAPHTSRGGDEEQADAHPHDGREENEVHGRGQFERMAYATRGGIA